MSSVVSIDSDGIWKACTMKVIAKTAITTVETKDCSDVSHESLCCGSGGVAVTGTAGWSTRISGGVLILLDLAPEDADEDDRAPARPRVVELAFLWMQTRAQHIQACRQ